MVEQQIFETPPPQSESEAPEEVIEKVAETPVPGAEFAKVTQKERLLKPSIPDVQIPASYIRQNVEAVSLSGFNLDVYPPKTKAMLVRDERRTTASLAILRTISEHLGAVIVSGKPISEDQFVRVQRLFAAQLAGITSLLFTYKGAGVLNGIEGGWFTPITRQNIIKAVRLCDEFIRIRERLFPKESNDEFSELSQGIGFYCEEGEFVSQGDRYQRANAEFPTSQDLLFHTSSNPEAIISSTRLCSRQAQFDRFGKARRNISSGKPDNVERYPLFFSAREPVNGEPVFVFSKRALLSNAQFSYGSRDIALYHRDYHPGDVKNPGFEVDLLRDPFLLVVQGESQNAEQIFDYYRTRLATSTEFQRRVEEEGLAIDPDQWVRQHVMIVADYGATEMQRVQEQLFARNQISELQTGSFVPTGSKPDDIDPGKDLGYLYEYRRGEFKYFTGSPPRPGQYSSVKSWIDALKLNSPTLRHALEFRLSGDLTVEGHTVAVVDLDRTFYGEVEVGEDGCLDFFESAVLTMHDVGKRYARESSALTDEQHIYTGVIVRDVLHELGYSLQQVDLAVAIVEQDIIGKLITHHIDVDQAAAQIRREAQRLGLPTAVFFGFLERYYKVDAGFYVRGGFRNFDTVLEFDASRKQISFIGEAARIIDILQTKLAAE